MVNFKVTFFGRIFYLIGIRYLLADCFEGIAYVTSSCYHCLFSFMLMSFFYNNYFSCESSTFCQSDNIELLEVHFREFAFSYRS